MNGCANMTDIFEFTLVFKLPAGASAPESFLDALHETGCSDATIGLGRPGFIGFAFDRSADSLEAAIESAERDVIAVIPGAVRVTS